MTFFWVGDKMMGKFDFGGSAYQLDEVVARGVKELKLQKEKYP